MVRQLCGDLSRASQLVMRELGPMLHFPTPNWIFFYHMIQKDVEILDVFILRLCVCTLWMRIALSEQNDANVLTDMSVAEAPLYTGPWCGLWALPQKLLRVISSHPSLMLIIFTKFFSFQEHSISPYIFIRHVIIS